MIRWALRTLMAEPAATLASALGLATALFLVAFLEGVFVGISEEVVRYLERSDAEVWVMGKRVRNMHMATSFVAASSLAAVRDVEGVAEATPILYLNTMVEVGDDYNWFAYIVGTMPGAPRGRAWAAVKGRRVPQRGEAVVPRILAAKGNLDLGDEVTITDRRYRIVGLSEETFSMANSVVFLHWDDVADLTGQQTGASYVLVKAKTGTSPVELAGRIAREVDEVAAFDKATFVAADRALALHMGAELIASMTLVGAVVGALVVGWTMFVLVSRRRHELAVAKALGASNRAVVAAVALQALALTLIGYGIALVVALPVEGLVTHAVPEVTVGFSANSLLRLGLVALAVSLLAALVPARRVLKLDPAEVFA